MSLINDALKRAKQSQASAAPQAAPQLQFRPVEDHQTARRGIGLILPVAFALLALFGLLFLWQLREKQNAAKALESARAAELVARAATAPALAPAVLPPPAPAPEPIPEPPVVTEAIAYLPETVAPDPTPEITQQPPVPAPEPPPAPKPAPLRLQAIVFNPASPSAMINGKTLFVGDKVAGFQIDSITQKTATLVNGGQTNILELAE